MSITHFSSLWLFGGTRSTWLSMAALFLRPALTSRLSYPFVLGASVIIYEPLYALRYGSPIYRLALWRCIYYWAVMQAEMLVRFVGSDLCKIWIAQRIALRGVICCSAHNSGLLLVLILATPEVNVFSMSH